MANALVVGGAGYVGVEVVRQLREKGDAVIVFDRVPYPDDSVETILSDFTNKETLDESLEGRSFDVIYHIASLPGDTGDPYQMMNVNVMGLLNLLEWTRPGFIPAHGVNGYGMSPGLLKRGIEITPINAESYFFCSLSTRPFNVVWVNSENHSSTKVSTPYWPGSSK